VQVESKRSGVLGSSNWAKESKDAEREKVEGVLNWPAPRNVKEVQKFLGFANYYRRFIKDFARIAAPLHMLVRKEQK